MPRRSFRRLLLAIMAATFAMFAGAVSPASADQGDKQAGRSALTRANAFS